MGEPAIFQQFYFRYFEGVSKFDIKNVKFVKKRRIALGTKKRSNLFVKNYFLFSTKKENDEFSIVLLLFWRENQVERERGAVMIRRWKKGSIYSKKKY